MAIKGISEVRRLPRLGKIRLGIRQQSGKGREYPKAVDYFVVRPDRCTSEMAARAFHKEYGDKPRELDIMFPTDNKEQFFPQWYRRYGKGTGLICKGDGELAVELDRETGEMKEIPCTPDCPWLEKKHCRPVGTLLFLLYKVPGLGAWQIDTSSYHSIVNLNSAIDFVRTLTGGRIAMIPLKLVIRPKEVTADGWKKVVYVLDLASEKIRLEDILRASQQPIGTVLALPELNLDEAPDDLYPQSLIEDDEQKPEAQEQEAQEQEAQEDPIDAELHKAWDQLSTPPAKRKAILAKPKLNKEKLLASLHAEIARRKARDEAQRKQEQEAQHAQQEEQGQNAQGRAEKQEGNGNNTLDASEAMQNDNANSVNTELKEEKNPVKHAMKLFEGEVIPPKVEQGTLL